MDLTESVQRSQKRCPHCGRLLERDPRFTYTFHNWSTHAYVIIISVMLILIDFIQNGAYTFAISSFFQDFNNRTEWSKWAVLGLWAFYLPAQYLRSRPHYGWFIVPLFGAVFDVFFVILDEEHGANSGFLGLDWAWYVILPISTFIIAFPLIARMARIQPTYLDQLEYLVDTLDSEVQNEH